MSGLGGGKPAGWNKCCPDRGHPLPGLKLTVEVPTPTTFASVVSKYSRAVKTTTTKNNIEAEIKSLQYRKMANEDEWSEDSQQALDWLINLLDTNF